MRSLVAEALEQLRAASLGLSSLRGPYPPRRPAFFAPLLLGAIAVSSVPGLVAAPAAGLLASAVLLAAATRRGAPRGLLAAPALSAAFAAVAGLPLAAWGRPVEAALFVLRVSAAATLSSAAVASAGWGCLGLPWWAAEWPRLLLLGLYVLSGEALRLSAAREARTMAGPGGLLEEWRTRAGLVAAVLDKSAERARVAAAAATARTMAAASRRAGGGCGGSLAPYLPPLAALAAAAAEALGVLP